MLRCDAPASHCKIALLAETRHKEKQSFCPAPSDEGAVVFSLEKMTEGEKS